MEESLIFQIINIVVSILSIIAGRIYSENKILGIILEVLVILIFCILPCVLVSN